MRPALLTIMATKKASALKAFITGIVCVVMVGLGWLSDPAYRSPTKLALL
jgi:formate/nitrite transporter FocA (FNT family)